MPYTKEVNFNVQATGNLTSNLNYLAPTSFRMTIDKLKFPNVEYSVQSVFIPDITVPAAPLSTPQRRLGIVGDKIDYAPVTLTFLIDEDLKNYIEIHDWMLGTVNQKDTAEYRKERDMTLSIISSHNNVTKQLQFVDAFPSSLSSLPFDVTITDITYLQAQVTFEYSYFKII
ncbi:MAG: hypothetical protein CBB72_016405 [Muricauda sp. TMED12]|nr:MAG: hypothetical protein CBB72_016405 [Muricauda sp. TMED12]